MFKEGQKFIELIRLRWLYSGLIACLIFGLAMSLILLSIWNIFSVLSYWFIAPLGVIIAFFTVKTLHILKINQKDVSRLLNQNNPQLEESCFLVLRNEETLNNLEKIQAQKVANELKTVKIPDLIYKRLKISCILLLLSVLVWILMGQIKPIDLKIEATSLLNTKSIVADKILPEIATIELRITPPSYTKKGKRLQKQFTAFVEDGSLLDWVIETNQSIKQIEFVFNDAEIYKLLPLNKNRTRWTFSKIINKSGFYQVKLDGELSDFYKLELIKDEAVIIRVLSPKQYSFIDIGEPKRINLQVQVTDDYGIEEVYISATSSSGKGEGVQFKEQIIRFNNKISGAKEYKLQKEIDLSSLGMQAGDELYFYIHAMDSRKQVSRSDVYQVSIQDTASLMSMDGMLGGVNLVPEYFRSQRQIIIDTEKILKERKSISEEEFKSRSNNLGIDQKLLRLRYGKFLGEESEGEIGGGHDDHEGHDDHDGHDDEAGTDFGNAQKIMDSYAHKHDVAEDATFFEPVLKAQLKATLAEMWKSELRLRTYKPEEALPFAYKALRLLKDLQQKSRAYVSKTALKTAPIKEEKRLSGELDKITQSVAERKISKNDEQNSLKKTIALIEKLRAGETLNQQDRAILQEANQKIATKAISEPSNYLNALQIIRKIVSTTNNLKISTNEFTKVETALHKMIKEESKSPQLIKKSKETSLSSEYFKRLKQEQP